MNSEIPRLEPRRAPRTAVAALIGSLLIPAACGGATTELPSTSTTVIESTTTTPTTLPPTTTPPTTVPETTTTTEVKDITKASGDIWAGGKRLTELGLAFTESANPIMPNSNVMLINPIALSIKTVNFQGEQKKMYVLEASLGRYEDGEPYIREYVCDFPGEFNGLFAYIPYTRNFFAPGAFPEAPPPTFESQELANLIFEAIDKRVEIGISTPYYIPNNFTTCEGSACVWFDEVRNRIEYNNNTVADLENQSEDGIIRVDREEPDMGSVVNFYIFPPKGGWPNQN